MVEEDVDLFMESMLHGDFEEFGGLLPEDVHKRFQVLYDTYKNKTIETNTKATEKNNKQVKSFGLELTIIGLTAFSFTILIIFYGRVFKELFSSHPIRGLQKLVFTTCLLLGAFSLYFFLFFFS